MQLTVLIIDDEKKLSNLLRRIIELEGYRVAEAGTGKEGLQIMEREAVHIIISDVKLPDVNGVDLVKAIKNKKSYVEVICLTAYGTITDGVTAMKNGAFDYLVKGNDNDKIIPLLAKAAEKVEVQFRLHQMEQRLVRQHSFDNIIGSSPVILAARQMAQKVAPTDTTVLLLGQTGTGKEVFAQAIHYNSNRKTRNFVAVNCSAFSKDLLESELFGYRAGAFTGAVKDKRGLLDEADGGTLFLDEIGEMHADLQAKLLRVIESGEFIKVGDTKAQRVQVRLIAATNRNLEAEISAGNFRQDLFYRLSVFTISLPSLSERKEDIKPLAEYYLKEYAAKTNISVQAMEPAFFKKLENYAWKGNIRELRNIIERAVILCEGPTLTANLLPTNHTENESAEAIFEMAAIERWHIKKVLKHTNGNKTEAARLMNIGLTTLYRKMEEYNI